MASVKENAVKLLDIRIIQETLASARALYVLVYITSQRDE
jgi:hypothetical protein